MKIIHIVLGKARLNRMNGINKVSHNLALHQAQEGHEVSIWGITPSPNIEVEARPYALRLFQAQDSPMILDLDLIYALSELSPEDTMVHLHGSFIPAFFWIARKLVGYKIPYVYCPHGSLSPGALKKHPFKKRVYFKFIESYILKHAHAVHFLGKTQYESIDKLLRIQQKELIPNGQNMSELEFDPQPFDRPGIPVFSFCGRLDIHHKGLDILMDGFARYRMEGGKGELWLIGDGADRSFLVERSKELGVDYAVVFWGSRFGEEKLNLLSHSDVFVHCSRYEGMPTGVLEAAGLGLPCILSDATNLVDMFLKHKAGLALRPNVAGQLTRLCWQVEEAYNDGNLSFMGASAREMVGNHFNWAEITNAVLQMYQRSYAG